jgi:lysophospholipase L1-like esterase
MSFVGHLSRLAVVAAFVASTTIALPIPSSVARADTAQAAPSDGKTAEQAAVATDAADAARKGVAAKAIDRVKEVAKSATDILSRVPCRAPKGGMKAMGALPHVASKLAAGKPVVIVAFGSSSTQGWGSTAPEFTYPNRLAAQLHRAYPGADIAVLNRGKGGEDAPEMMARLQNEVINAKPDLVIWQVGTNAVLRNLDPAETGKMIEDGVGRIQAAGSDVVLVDPQYSPATTSKPEGTGKMLSLMHKVAELRKVGIFPRFEVMKEWHESQQMAFDSFVISDGLHMNDWGYACFAQLLGDNIIKSVGQVKMGINEPQIQQAQKPL